VGECFHPEIEAPRSFIHVGLESQRDKPNQKFGCASLDLARGRPPVAGNVAVLRDGTHSLRIATIGSEPAARRAGE
jgi:hypothetical protein